MGPPILARFHSPTNLSGDGSFKIVLKGSQEGQKCEAVKEEQFEIHDSNIA